MAILLAGPAQAAGPAPDTSGIGFDQRQGTILPLDAPFTDSDGRAVTIGGLLHGPAVLLLGYFHCPSLCGVVRDDALAALAGTALVAGQDYTLLDVSIDPDETPAQAAAARTDDLRRLGAPGAAQGWHFLTGRADSIAALRAAAGFRSRYDDSLEQFLHPAGLVFITPAGAVSGYAMGVGYTPDDVRTGLQRARTGTFATAASVLLLCLHFDPVTGRYSVEIVKLLQLAGGLTVLAIGGLLLMLARRRIRRPA